MAKIDEYNPSGFEYLVTGIIGTIIYIWLVGLVTLALSKGVRNSQTRAFFYLLLVMCLFEIPRYLTICIFEDYNSRMTYVCHIFASTIYFAAFSIVCSQWAGLLQLGMIAGYIYSNSGLFFANIFFGLFDFIAAIFCLAADDLEMFFESFPFAVYILVDAVKTTFYSALLAYYGIKLVLKFYRYNKIELAIGNNNIFGTALNRVTIVLMISTICSLVRISMLIMKLLATHTHMIVTRSYFSLFGLLWFVCSDFIPRVLPSYMFIILMRAKSYNNNHFNKKLKLMNSQFKYHGVKGVDTATGGDKVVPFVHHNIISDQYGDSYDDLVIHDDVRSNSYEYVEQDEDEDDEEESFYLYERSASTELSIKADVQTDSPLSESKRHNHHPHNLSFSDIHEDIVSRNSSMATIDVDATNKNQSDGFLGIFRAFDSSFMSGSGKGVTDTNTTTTNMNTSSKKSPGHHYLV